MQLKPFDKQTAIITGAGQGIGFEIARQLCANGVSVISERCGYIIGK